MFRRTVLRSLRSRYSQLKPAFFTPFKRSFSSAPPTHFQKRTWPRVLGVTLLLAGSYLGWKWYTHHNYPLEVAQKLKEGLMAELNGSGYRQPDNKKALMFYIEALHIADKLEMSPLSDEYTGIQFKIADMYARLGYFDEAMWMYTEVCGVYLSALERNAFEAQSRVHAIKRVLMIATTMALYMEDRPQIARLSLLPSLVAAEKELARNSPEIVEAFKGKPSDPSLVYQQFKDGLAPNNSLTGYWPEFRDQLFALREVYTASSIAVGDYYNALLTKLRTTELQLTSGANVGDMLLSTTNIASLLYLQGSFEQVTTKDMKESGENPSQDTIIDRKTDLEGVGAGNLPGVPSKEKLYHPVPASLVADPKLTGPDAYFAAARAQYQFVLDRISKLGIWQRRGPFVSEAQAIATYGLGVVACHYGEWAKAEEYLREARLRARGLEVESLMDSAQSELSKIEKLKSLPKDSPELAELQLPDLQVMFWKLDPAEWAGKDQVELDV